MGNLKNHILPTFIAVILITYASCKRSDVDVVRKDSIQNTLHGTPISIPSGTISSQYGMLHFSSRETFLDIMDTLNKKTYAQSLTWEAQFSGFISLRSIYDVSPAEESTESPCEDDDLNTVLNSNSMIWIDNTAFLLDWAKVSIYEVYPVNLATIDSVKLKKEILNNDSMYVMRYSMEEEILFPDSSVQYIGVFKWLKKVFGRCTDQAANHQSAAVGSPRYYDNGQTGSSKVEYKYKYKVTYQRAGIYFSILWKVKHYRKTHEQNSWHAYTGIACAQIEYGYKKYCGGSDSDHEFCPLDHSQTSWNKVDHKWKRRIYGGGTRLAKYSVDIIPYLENVTDQSELISDNSVIEDNWP